jgi:hypothetical protein
MAEIVVELGDVARVVAYRIREDLKTVDPDSPSWLGLMENHAKDLDRLADKLSIQAQVDREALAKAVFGAITHNVPVDGFGGEDERLRAYASIWANASATAVLALLSPEETK